MAVDIIARAMAGAIAAQEAKETVRLSYSANENPTADEINDFVVAQGYQAPFAKIAVVVQGTNHVWHYYTNDDIGWRDDGTGAVTLFTNSEAGIIKGSTADGAVAANTDGTGYCVGFSELKSQVGEIGNVLDEINGEVV